MSDAPTQVQVSSAATSESKLEAWAPPAGEIIGGRYRVLRVIGQGGMGAVVAAEHVQLGEPVAIKFLHPKLARDTQSVERFFREAKSTMRIKSEHVVRIVDVGRSDSGVPFIVMELLEGADLGRVLGSGPLAISHAVDFVLQACEALAEAHASGIVHRDLKPSNLWLARRPDGSPLVKVLDFGISKLSSHAPGDPKLTETQSVFGSPTYMSPEQIRSSKKVDHRTDVWALGIVLHELLTGKLPFDGDTVSGVLASIAADPPVPLRNLRPDAPPALEAAILRCLEKDLSRRCQSLAELAVLLAPFASPIGLISAGRIARIGAPDTSGQRSSLPSPAVSSGAGLGGVTDATFSTASHTGRSRSPLLGVLIGMAVALLVVGLVAVGVKLEASRSAMRAEPTLGLGPRAQAPALPGAGPPPPTVALPTPPAPSSVPAPSASAPLRPEPAAARPRPKPAPGGTPALSPGPTAPTPAPKPTSDSRE